MIDVDQVGQVTIPLKDYLTFLSIQEKAEKKIKQVDIIFDNLGVLLSTLYTEKKVYDTIQVFNARSSAVMIHEKDGRVTLEIKE